MTWQKLTVSSVINEELGDVKESPHPKKLKGIVYFYTVMKYLIIH